jgi:hypothetical protein
MLGFSVRPSLRACFTYKSRSVPYLIKRRPFTLSRHIIAYFSKRTVVGVAATSWPYMTVLRLQLPSMHRLKATIGLLISNPTPIIALLVMHPYLGRHLACSLQLKWSYVPSFRFEGTVFTHYSPFSRVINAIEGPQVADSSDSLF